MHLQDGHDEASGSSSEVDDATETKVLVISSSDPAPPCDESLVSETEFFTVRMNKVEHLMKGKFEETFHHFSKNVQLNLFKRCCFKLCP
jgi:hypothetical protein